MKALKLLIISISLFIASGFVYFLIESPECYIQSGVVISKYYSTKGGYSVRIYGINKYTGKQSSCVESIPYTIGIQCKIGDTINIK